MTDNDDALDPEEPDEPDEDDRPSRSLGWNLSDFGIRLPPIIDPNLLAGLFRFPALEELARQQREAMSKTFAPLFQQQREAMSKTFAPLFQQQFKDMVAPVFEQLRRTTGGAFESLAEVLRASKPSNWPDDVRLSEMADLIEETGWPLVWVPDADLIQELLDSDAQDVREKILLDNSDRVVASVRARLDEVRSPRREYAVSVAREAADCFESGYERGCQALAMTTLTGLVHSATGEERLGHAKRFLAEWAAVDEWGWYRLTLIAARTVATLANFNPIGKPARALNRHSSAHGPSAEQFTRLNALLALMLVTAFLRELEELEAKGKN